ncbi:MAPEG family protein [Allosphingosinicella flava]|uniref:MAPEG family protein n=1 Tax=Allosphingosinicella flava TaxID=2771430 RepID=A0A7T2LM34_9SPHN|nr:MAPEG family protein [Sphingosinicella flava]QPQ55104.1 MAPEG family protein [Sphingosinicella flava]
MTIELTVLALGCLLAVVHIILAVNAKTRQYGRAWNMGARDEELPPLNPLAGRLDRARGNFLETFPIAIAAILIVTVAERTNAWTAAGALLWLAARAVYLPLYAAGIPKIRTLVYTISMAGLAMILAQALL